MKNCPSCGLTNPDTAMRCDCGFSFATGATTRVLVTARESIEARTPGAGIVLAIHALLWVAVIASALYAAAELLMLATPTNAIQQSAVSSFAIPPVVSYVLARAFDELTLRRSGRM